MSTSSLFLLVASLTLAAPAAADETEGRHLKNIRQLTTVGKNGEGYFAPDGQQIIFQSIRGQSPYYQMYVMAADGSGQRMISSGRGKTTCGWFVPGGITFASTHLDPGAFLPGRDKPPAASPRSKYLWDFDSAMDVFQTDLQGKNERRLTTSPGYDAEASWSWDGKQMVFTSERSGDLEIWIASADGKDARRLTWATGYDGGPFFSPDGKLVVFRGFRGDSGRAAEIYLIGADGRGERQLTNLGAVSWAPFFHPDGKRIIFTTNWKGAHPGDFDLYIMNLDGSGLERVTSTPGFDGLPTFSRDGKHLLWTSNRVGKESQLFLADWQ